jgi:hypothetical protein
MPTEQRHAASQRSSSERRDAVETADVGWYDWLVPEISRFYGIVIRMFMEAGETHHRPHFHAYCGDEVAIVGLNPVEFLAGDLPRRQARLVLAWAEIHEGALLDDWQRLQDGRLPLPIEPLR